MRKMTLTVALAALMVLPAVAQFRPGQGGGFGQLKGDALLTNKSVQKELKLTEEQVKDLGEVSTKYFEAMKEARDQGKDDRDKAREIMKKAGETQSAALKGVREKLTSEQQKRFAQIEVQVAAKNKDVTIFKNPSVVKALGITEEQQAKVKEALEGIEKDTKELFDEAKDDRKKRFEAMKRAGELGGEAFDAAVKALSADQKKAWDDAKGEKFEYKSDFAFPGRDKGGKGNKDKKKDDI